MNSYLTFFIAILAMLNSSLRGADVFTKTLNGSTKSISFNLNKVGVLKCQPLAENSGMALSCKNPNMLWTHNDSGDLPRLFLFEKSVGSEWGEKHSMVFIQNYANKDWEDLCFASNGYLYVGSFGNNLKRRKTGEILFFKEPVVDHYIQGVDAKRILFAYENPVPESKTSFKSEDCEAFFQFKSSLILLTKHMLKPLSEVYILRNALNHFENRRMNAEFIMRLKGMRGVTSADSWNRGEKIVILTYSHLWVFEPKSDQLSELFDHYKVIRISAKQCESVCFEDENTVIITNEQRDVYRIKINF